MKQIWTKDTVLFDKCAKLNNFIKPYDGYVIDAPVLKNKFPEQDSDKLLSTIRINYRDVQDCYVGEETGLDPVHQVRQTFATILRYDTTEPYKCICVDKLGRMFIGNTQDIEAPMLYTVQQYNFYNMQVVDAYRDLREENIGLCVRCDDMNPAYAIMMELDIVNKTMRFVVTDEIFPKMLTDLEKELYESYYDVDIALNYPKVEDFDPEYDNEKTMKEFIENLLNEEGYSIYGKVSND